MTFGSFATEIRESCQVRNEAALSGSFRVPGGCLDRVGSLRKRPGYEFEIIRAVFADVAELADAIDLGSIVNRRAGSIPVIRIFLCRFAYNIN